MPWPLKAALVWALALCVVLPATSRRARASRSGAAARAGNDVSSLTHESAWEPLQLTDGDPHVVAILDQDRAAARELARNLDGRGGKYATRYQHPSYGTWGSE